jgi:hypothetical protein
MANGVQFDQIRMIKLRLAIFEVCAVFEFFVGDF